MLFCDVKMKFNYGNNDLVEDKADDLGQNLLTSEYYLGFILGIELEVEPRDLEHVHPVQVILHSQVFIPLHLNELLHHQF
jgi:hypothetical protein